MHLFSSQKLRFTRSTSLHSCISCVLLSDLHPDQSGRHAQAHSFCASGSERNRLNTSSTARFVPSRCPKRTTKFSRRTALALCSHPMEIFGSSQMKAGLPHPWSSSDGSRAARLATPTSPWRGAPSWRPLYCCQPRLVDEGPSSAALLC